MTFGQLRLEALGWLDEYSATSTDQSYLNVEAALKQAHITRLTEHRWKFMLYPGTHSITTVANQYDYSLHPEFLRPYWVRNATKKVWLVETPDRNFETDNLDPVNDQDTFRFELGGYSGVVNQPSSASTVSIVSTSVSDTGASLAAKVYGEVVTGGIINMTWEDITPNGTTPVASSTSFTRILSIVKPVWTGNLTATSNSGTVTNVFLIGREYSRQFRQLTLLYLPTAGETLTYRFYRRPNPDFGENDNDSADIPAPFDRILIYDALLLMGAYDNRLDGGRINLWTGLRDDLDREMREVYSSGQSIAAEGRFITDRSNIFTSVRFPE